MSEALLFMFWVNIYVGLGVFWAIYMLSKRNHMFSSDVLRFAKQLVYAVIFWPVMLYWLLAQR